MFPLLRDIASHIRAPCNALKKSCRFKDIYRVRNLGFDKRFLLRFVQVRVSFSLLCILGSQLVFLLIKAFIFSPVFL